MEKSKTKNEAPEEKVIYLNYAKNERNKIIKKHFLIGKIEIILYEKKINAK